MLERWQSKMVEVCMPRTKNGKRAGSTTQRPERQKTVAETVAQPALVKLAAFAVGDRISHPQFGDGTITAIEGPKLSIAFDARGEKQIIDSYVKRLKK
jgi:DNA helicase-2/ATP-dependent DNA helicase PcrA